MECRVESLMRNEVLLEYEEDQVRQLEEDMRKTKDTFMFLADSLIATLKVEIEAQRVHSIKVEKITRFLNHTPTVTPEKLKPIMENKLKYEDEDEVEIKMIGTGMDKESLEHNLYKNDMTWIICHNFSPTSNPPIKPKDLGIFRMKENMDDPNITIEEYIRLEEEKVCKRGKVYNWETAKYGKIWYDEDVHDLRSIETEFPAIVFDDAFTSEVTPSYEPTVSPLNDNKIDFRISFGESDDEDYMVIYDENSFSYKIIYVNDLKTDLENDNDKVNMPSFPSPEPT
ncbi:hypothetical protein Tco_0759133, partial [Tanacetum coccineum]